MKRLITFLTFLLVAHAAWAAIAIDGTATATGGFTSSITSGTLTTTQTNDVVIVYVTTINGTSAATVSSMSGCGLTWTKRYASGPITLVASSGNIEEWYAKSSGTLSCAVTANFAFNPTFSDITVFGISVANTTTVFDTNGGLPNNAHSNTAGSPSVGSVSTSNASDMLISGALTYGTPGNPPTGWTTINTSGLGHQDNAYKVVSSTQSGITVTYGASSTGGWIIVVDAVQAAGAVSSGNFTFVAAPVP